MQCSPSSLMAEPPDVLSTLLAVIQHADEEAKRAAQARR
jgi:hypothetical protein